ncbi:N-(5'-phosphoribosyl)anthranilate isomerase [Roseobacter sp. SK209-2-6]|nr:N-(5'-phosphoribosyl)anthranilate isomerase [Roseobacter sp. SK209-2-6]
MEKSGDIILFVMRLTGSEDFIMRSDFRRDQGCTLVDCVA